MAQLNLQDIRVEIDIIDRQLIDLLAERTNLVREVAEYKRLHNLPVLDATREQEVIAQRTLQGEAVGLSVEFVTTLFTLIMANSRQTQHQTLPYEFESVATDHMALPVAV